MDNPQGPTRTPSLLLLLMMLMPMVFLGQKSSPVPTFVMGPSSLTFTSAPPSLRSHTWMRVVMAVLLR
jgi:hypothetical protein